MKLYQYLSLKDNCDIQHLTLLEHGSYIINDETYKELYYNFDNNRKMGYHQLTYSSNNESISSEFYVLADDNDFLMNDKVKMTINFLNNTIIFYMYFQKVQKIIPITFYLIYENTSCELSQLLKQNEINVHILSKKMQGYHKEDTIKVALNEKHKAVILEFVEMFLNSYNMVDGKKIMRIEDMMIKRKISYLKVPINREDIEKMDTTKYENMLSALYPSVFVTHEVCEKVSITVLGYEEDNREIWQIPEVRRFIRTLHDKFPFWFYFLDKNTDSLYWITMCLCAKRFEGSYKLIMDSTCFNDFMNGQLKNLHDILYYINDNSKEEDIIQRVFRYYDNYR